MEMLSRVNAVLVVEDEPILRQLSVFELEDAGYEVLEAASADEALKVMNSGKAVGLMFTDVNMPGSMDGLELARVAHRLWPSVKLIVTSGAGRVRQSDVPDDGRFLAKPYSLSELSKTVGELTGGPEKPWCECT
jgi:CheY-like chemotaxis protein